MDTGPHRRDCERRKRLLPNELQVKHNHNAGQHLRQQGPVCERIQDTAGRPPLVQLLIQHGKRDTQFGAAQAAIRRQQFVFVRGHAEGHQRVEAHQHKHFGTVQTEGDQQDRVVRKHKRQHTQMYYIERAVLAKIEGGKSGARGRLETNSGKIYEFV